MFEKLKDYVKCDLDVKIDRSVNRIEFRNRTKSHVKRRRKQATDWAKIFKKDVMILDLYPVYIKNFQNPLIRNQTKQQKGKNLSRYFTKEDLCSWQVSP